MLRASLQLAIGLLVYQLSYSLLAEIEKSSPQSLLFQPKSTEPGLSPLFYRADKRSVEFWAKTEGKAQPFSFGTWDALPLRLAATSPPSPRLDSLLLPPDSMQSPSDLVTTSFSVASSSEKKIGDRTPASKPGKELWTEWKEPEQMCCLGKICKEPENILETFDFKRPIQPPLSVLKNAGILKAGDMPALRGSNCYVACADMLPGMTNFSCQEGDKKGCGAGGKRCVCEEEDKREFRYTEEYCENTDYFSKAGRDCISFFSKMSPEDRRLVIQRAEEEISKVPLPSKEDPEPQPPEVPTPPSGLPYGFDQTPEYQEYIRAYDAYEREHAAWKARNQSIEAHRRRVSQLGDLRICLDALNKRDADNRKMREYVKSRECGKIGPFHTADWVHLSEDQIRERLNGCGEGCCGQGDKTSLFLRAQLACGIANAAGEHEKANKTEQRKGYTTYITIPSTTDPCNTVKHIYQTMIEEAEAGLKEYTSKEYVESLTQDFMKGPDPTPQQRVEAITEDNFDKRQADAIRKALGLPEPERGSAKGPGKGEAPGGEGKDAKSSKEAGQAKGAGSSPSPNMAKEGDDGEDENLPGQAKGLPPQPMRPTVLAAANAMYLLTVANELDKCNLGPCRNQVGSLHAKLQDTLKRQWEAQTKALEDAEETKHIRTNPLYITRAEWEARYQHSRCLWKMEAPTRWEGETPQWQQNRLNMRKSLDPSYRCRPGTLKSGAALEAACKNNEPPCQLERIGSTGAEGLSDLARYANPYDIIPEFTAEMVPDAETRRTLNDLQNQIRVLHERIQNRLKNNQAPDPNDLRMLRMAQGNRDNMLKGTTVLGLPWSVIQTQVHLHPGRTTAIAGAITAITVASCFTGGPGVFALSRLGWEAARREAVRFVAIALATGMAMETHIQWSQMQDGRRPNMNLCEIAQAGLIAVPIGATVLLVPTVALPIMMMAGGREFFLSYAAGDCYTASAHAFWLFALPTLTHSYRHYFGFVGRFSRALDKITDASKRRRVAEEIMQAMNRIARENNGQVSQEKLMPEIRRILARNGIPEAAWGNIQNQAWEFLLGEVRKSITDAQNRRRTRERECKDELPPPDVERREVTVDETTGQRLLAEMREKLGPDFERWVAEMNQRQRRGAIPQEEGRPRSRNRHYETVINGELQDAFLLHFETKTKELNDMFGQETATALVDKFIDLFRANLEREGISFRAEYHDHKGSRYVFDKGDKAKIQEIFRKTAEQYARELPPAIREYVNQVARGHMRQPSSWFLAGTSETGPPGAAGRRSGTVMGDEANIASRSQRTQQAPPGESLPPVDFADINQPRPGTPQRPTFAGEIRQLMEGFDAVLSMLRDKGAHRRGVLQACGENLELSFAAIETIRKATSWQDLQAKFKKRFGLCLDDAQARSLYGTFRALDQMTPPVGVYDPQPISLADTTGKTAFKVDLSGQGGRNAQAYFRALRRLMQRQQQRIKEGRPMTDQELSAAMIEELRTGLNEADTFFNQTRDRVRQSARDAARERGLPEPEIRVQGDDIVVVFPRELTPAEAQAFREAFWGRLAQENAGVFRATSVGDRGVTGDDKGRAIDTAENGVLKRLTDALWGCGEHKFPKSEIDNALIGAHIEPGPGGRGGRVTITLGGQYSPQFKAAIERWGRQIAQEQGLEWGGVRDLPPSSNQRPLQGAVPPRGPPVNLDEQYGRAVEPSRIDPDLERGSDGSVHRNPNLQRPTANQPLRLDPDKRYLWMVDENGDLLVGQQLYEAQPDGSVKQYEHPSLNGGGRGRIAGELIFDKTKNAWVINPRSGRYSQGQNRTPQQLENAANLFRQGGVNVQTDTNVK